MFRAEADRGPLTFHRRLTDARARERARQRNGSGWLVPGMIRQPGEYLEVKRPSEAVTEACFVVLKGRRRGPAAVGGRAG
jgi:hypothetical protein